jgi:1-acyl-sn-glycerol-3-phosphate acyltransferase
VSRLFVEERGLYRVLRAISALPRWYFRFRAEGAGHLPATGPCIIAANHVSYLDPIVIAMACPRPVRFIMSRDFYQHWSIHWLCRATGAVPVENNPRDLGSLRRTLQALRDGAVVGIFPEGGRSGDGSLKPGRPGAALLALRAGVPLIPAGIVGTFAAFSRHQRFPRRKSILVRFGQPLAFPDQWRGGAAKEHLEEATAMLMERIQALCC